MNTIATQISNNLPAGYKVVNVEESKTSTYFYISDPDGVVLKARKSNHDAMCAASLSHVQVLSYYMNLSIDFDFETVYDSEDYEVELTKAEAANQLSVYFGVNILESEIMEADEFSCIIATEDWKKEESIIGKFIAIEITKVESTNLY